MVIEDRFSFDTSSSASWLGITEVFNILQHRCPLAARELTMTQPGPAYDLPLTLLPETLSRDSSILSISVYVVYPTCSISVAAAAAAKSLQSCPTLCDPIDGSLPGSPLHGGFSRQEHWSGSTVTQPK